MIIMAYLLIKPPHSRDDDNNRSNELWHPHIPAPKYKMPKGQAQLFVVDRWFTQKIDRCNIIRYRRCRGSGRWGCMLQYLKFEFQPPMMVYLSINEMELVVRLIINKNVWHGIFELTYLVKIIHFLHVKRNFEDRGGDGACIRHRR